MTTVRQACLAGACVWALLLSGCSAFTPQKIPPLDIDVPTAWTVGGPAQANAAAKPANPMATWWQHFDDPQLGKLVQQAMQANTSVNGAQAALRQAQALRDVAAASLWPTLGGSASAQAGTGGGNRTNDNFKVGLDANWVPARVRSMPVMPPPWPVRLVWETYKYKWALR